MNEKLDTERAITGKISEGATLVDIRNVPSFIRCMDECIWPFSPMNGGLKALDIHPTSYSDCKASLRVQKSTVNEGRGFIKSSMLDCGMKFWSRNPF